MLWRVFYRGCFFLALAFGSYGSCATFATLLGLASTETVFLLSWVDVAIAWGVAVVVGAIPSSRLRVLPVWLVCLTLPVARVLLGGAFMAAFAFGPGAYPIDVVDHVLTICLSPIGLAVLLGVALVSSVAAVRPPPSRVPGC